VNVARNGPCDLAALLLSFLELLRQVWYVNVLRDRHTFETI
jgi:hypothetical protein